MDGLMSHDTSGSIAASHSTTPGGQKHPGRIASHNARGGQKHSPGRTSIRVDSSAVSSWRKTSSGGSVAGTVSEMVRSALTAPTAIPLDSRVCVCCT